MAQAVEDGDVAGAPPRLAVRRISMESPWRWLGAAWSQLWQAQKPAFAYGLIFAALSLLLVVLLFSYDALALVLPMSGGFFLLGPFLAIGLYEVARRLERGDMVSLRDAIRPHIASPSQVAFLGVLLLIAHFVWVRIALFLFAVFFGADRGFPPLDQFIHDLFFTFDGLALLSVGTLVGGVLAAITFAMSAVSLPLMFDREIDAVTAMALSIRAVKENPGPMFVWAWLILLITAFGIATLFVGLILTFPLLGLATWHAYRELIVEE